MVNVATEYISVGGNRHPGAADWDVASGVLAYGADNNVALWAPEVSHILRLVFIFMCIAKLICLRLYRINQARASLPC